MMMVRIFFAAWVMGTLALSSASPGVAAKRLALVIGINDYPKLKTPADPSNGQLEKAVADAETMSEVLTALNFEVDIARNVGRVEFLTAVERLKRKVGPGDTVFVFFAGHGIAFSGTNLLLPSDIPPVDTEAEQLVRQLSVSENDVIDGLREKGTSLVILTLDACRNNPIEEFRRKEASRQARTYRSSGLMRDVGIVPRGSLGVFSIYSAGIGQRALDRLSRSDPDRNSVFTRIFARKLREPGRTLTDIMVSVRTEVTELASKVIDPETRAPHQQFPAYYDETRGGHIVIDGSQQPPASPPTTLHPPPAGPADAVARSDFQLAERVNTREVWEEFLRQHPTGFHAAVAKQRLAALASPVAPPPPAVPLSRRLFHRRWRLLCRRRLLGRQPFRRRWHLGCGRACPRIRLIPLEPFIRPWGTQMGLAPPPWSLPKSEQAGP